MKLLPSLRRLSLLSGNETDISSPTFLIRSIHLHFLYLYSITFIICEVKARARMLVSGPDPVHLGLRTTVMTVMTVNPYMCIFV